MTRYLQYEKMSGRIVGELFEAEQLPELYDSEIYGYLPVEDALSYDPRAWLVKDGQLVRAYETGTERRERERGEKEQKEQGLAFLRALSRDFLFALLFNDAEEIARIRQEAQPLKIYWN